MREELQKFNPGKWQASSNFELVEVALSHNMPVSEFRKMDVLDQAYFIANHRVTRTVSEWETHQDKLEQQRRERQSARRRGKR